MTDGPSGLSVSCPALGQTGCRNWVSHDLDLTSIGGTRRLRFSFFADERLCGSDDLRGKADDGASWWVLSSEPGAGFGPVAQLVRARA